MADQEHPDKQPFRTVTLEFLRAGPPHNQLLSPLTPYLAVCEEAEAVTVHVPWEHAPFLRRQEELRYEAGFDEDAGRRRGRLDEMGSDVAKLFGAIPAFSVVLNPGRTNDAGVTHLRLVLSASELGLVPFELSKVPSSLNVPSESWLLLQPHVPICLTRHVRSVPLEPLRWPRLRKPSAAHVLFVASDPDDLPFEEHREVLIDAVEPWLAGRSPDDRGAVGEGHAEIERFGDRLTILKNARLRDVKALCARRQFSHVHVLAHGGEDDSRDYRSFGIGLDGEIVDGDAFASALITTRGQSTQRPTVVTLASCDSANVASVVGAGGSFAHALHRAGIPLVVASQFPLTFEGSVTATRRMYVPQDGFLWGASHPIGMLHDVRRSLQVDNSGDAHDWASIVVYEAFPSTLPIELEAYHYDQSYAALTNSERRLDAVVEEILSPDTTKSKASQLLQDLKEARLRCEAAREALPDSGAFEMESIGIAASDFKTNAEASFRVAERFSSVDGIDNMELCLDQLQRAFELYAAAAKGFLGKPKPGAQHQQQSSLHWVVVQMLAMGTVLGRTLDQNLWGAAACSADEYLRISERGEQAWALGSKAELGVLRLANESLTPQQRRKISTDAADSARALVKLYARRDVKQITSTARQFRRYRGWWGSSTFTAALSAAGIKRRQSWEVRNGVLETAERIHEVLLGDRA